MSEAVRDDAPGQPAGPAGSWPAPAPGAAPMARMVAAQAGLELRTLFRNGEQLLLTLIIPVVLLAGFSLEPLIGPGTRVDFLVPGIIALGVMSTAFTSQAIATGFERRYGVLKRLGATPLRRSGLIAAMELGSFIGRLLSLKGAECSARARWCSIQAHRPHHITNLVPRPPPAKRVRSSARFGHCG